ncbi:MAG: hypothetical protein ABH864_05340 [archaeon]
MKKSVGLFLLAVLVISSFSFAFAEDASSAVDEETEAEVSVMNSNYGSKMRMLQLQYELERRIMRMEEVIAYLEEKGENVDELMGIVEELKLLAAEASGVSTDDFDGAVEKFIAIKDDAIGLVKEFREIVRGLLSEEDNNALRMRFSEANSAELDRLRNEFQNQRRLLNAEKVGTVLERMGKSDDDLKEKVANGEVNAEEARERLKIHYADLETGEKETVRERIRAEVNENAEAVRAKVNSYVQNMESTRVARVNDRAAQLQGVASTYAAERAGRLTNAG